ncbi:hypothetical protein D3C80_1881770 [compost metagenome]
MQGLFVQCSLFQRRQGLGVAIKLGQQLLQGIASMQHVEEHLGLRLHQRPFDFLPAALGGQGLQLA